MLEGVCWEKSGDVSLWLYKACSTAEGSTDPWLPLCWFRREG